MSSLPQNAAGATRTNTASAGYGYASQPTTLAQAQNPPKTIGSDVAPLTLTEPNVKIELVSSQDAITALPDDTFGCTIKVTNPAAGGVPTSTAYAVKVRDCVPDGISVVDAGTGTLGTDNTCTTTEKASITWGSDCLAGCRWLPAVHVHGQAQRQHHDRADERGQRPGWSSLTPDPEQPGHPEVRTDHGRRCGDSGSSGREDREEGLGRSGLHRPALLWTIEVTNPSTRNPGPTAYQVKVGDVLPPNWTYKAGTTVIKLDGAGSQPRIPQRTRPTRWP